MRSPRLFALILVSVTALAAADKPRLAILTDIGGDPDDEQSLIRLMVYANEFELDLLMATAVRWKHTKAAPSTRPHHLHQIVEAYGQVLPNLRRHAEGWPTVESLQPKIVAGNPHYGRDHVGAGHDTPGSHALIAAIDKGTPGRPLNIAIWGGQTDFAQALWRVREDRGAAGLADFTKKFRVYDIADQDKLADWMRTEFPGMFYILALTRPGPPRQEGTYRGMYVTGDVELTSRAWVDEHILSKGPLGALYPTKTWTVPNPHSCLKEGDTPSWFFFLPLGGNDPADPTKPGWGGQFQRRPDGWYEDLTLTDTVDPRITVSRWRPDYQADFAKRMAWCLPDNVAAAAK
jgi:hypothetical protein